MLIKRLEVKGLYGIYDYNVRFNDDMTFIYGENGSGKTTILDILYSIVTGRVYNLFSYHFKEIILTYRRSSKGRSYKIKIVYSDNNYEMSADENKLQEVIVDIHRNTEVYTRAENPSVYDFQFIKRYAIPRFLRAAFKYIYLPIYRYDRDDLISNDSLALYRNSRSSYHTRSLGKENYLNNSLRYIERIVQIGYTRITALENEANARFKNNVFISSLKVPGKYNVTNFIKYPNHVESPESIEKSKNEYINLLKTIGEWNDAIKEQVSTFFKKYSDSFEKAQKVNFEGERWVSIEFLLMNIEVTRMKEFASLGERLEKEKERIRIPVTSFLETVNRFLDLSEDKKQISINNEGKIIVKRKNSSQELSLYNLSSGEKQIVIIFACLAFKLPVESEGIFIIDEPEASLHLAWQKIFTESIQHVNNSLQLIFATHAPEIIGRYRPKATKLKKAVNDSAEEDEFKEKEYGEYDE